MKDENVLIYGRWIFSLNLMDLNTKIYSDKPFAFHAHILKDKSFKEPLFYTPSKFNWNKSKEKKNPVKRGNYGSWFDVKLNENEKCLCAYIGIHIYTQHNLRGYLNHITFFKVHSLDLEAN